MNKLSSVVARFSVLLAFTVVAVGCAAEADEEPEEEGSTESNLTKKDKAMTQVEEYANAHLCTPSVRSNGDTELECALAYYDSVWSYMNKKLGAKNVYKCGPHHGNFCIKH